MESDRAYFARRAAEEKEAAMRAAHPSARAPHLELAARYDDLAHHIEHHEKHLGAEVS